mgnify:CR=1 FL=1
MTSKARIERLTQLARASVGKTTKRPVADILATEKQAAANHIPRGAPVTPPATQS